MAKKISIFSLFCLLFFTVWGVFVLQSDAGLYQEVVRFHVLANSDSQQDQALKLAVRDKVVEAVSVLVADCDTQSQALARLEEEKEVLLTTAQQVLTEAGASHPVRVEIGKESYPTRYYEGMQFPAGVYDSVRVIIGEGAGQNWWCVLFPPLCTEVANVEEVMVESGFTQGQIRILTEADNPRYLVRFKALEVFQEWKDALGEK